MTVLGQEVRLTPKEFRLLAYAARCCLRVGANSVEQPEYLRVFIEQLRKKIEPDAASPRYFLTEPWVGTTSNRASKSFLQKF